MKRILSILICICMLIFTFAGCQSGAGTNAATTAATDTTIIGQVKSIEGSTITLALGTMDQSAAAGGQAPQGTPPQSGTNTPPSMPQGTPPGGAIPSSPPDGAGPPQQGSTDGSSGQTPPSMPQGGAPGGFTASGEQQTITVSDDTVITVQSMNGSSEGTISDITVGSILTVTMSGGSVKEMVVTAAMQGGMQGDPNMGGDTGSADLAGAYTVDGEEKTLSGEKLSSTQSDENTVAVLNGGSLTISGAELSKTGDTSNTDSSNFYGLNAVLVAAGGSSAEASDVKITSDAEGANAVFATGEGTVIKLSGVTISTTGNSSRGLDATYGGEIDAANVNITTTGAHCAPLATDRGEGTITVKGGTLSASGDGSPCIYSTGNISATGVTGAATGSQIAVVEGKNSITLASCKLTGAGLNGIMLYQSTSGDAAEGTANFKAADCELTTTSSGPMFYITNTDAQVNLENTKLIFSGGILVNAAGNSTNNWGTPGSNGGNFMLTGKNETLSGDIVCDNISTVTLNLTESTTFTGTVNADNTAKEICVSLDGSSVWNVTGDSYVTVITDADTAAANIISNGHTVYYDAANTANAWLNGQTIALSGGGMLVPAK